jgi:pimeloyl-ACP methyl ester carboxylesterase
MSASHSQSNKPQPIKFNVLDLQLAAQRWHEGGVPVIALHGWLDNSESFSLLAEHMPAIDLVALDMAGHGLSDHRAAHANYFIWDDLREILAVADQLGWPRFGLLGHSRGGIIAALLAAAAPERIRAVGLIDGLWAQTNPAAQTHTQIANSLQAEKNQRQEKRYFTSLEEMISLRQRNGFPLSDTAARQLVLRNAERGGDAWCWRTDPRHKLPSLMMLTPEQQEACHRAIQVPVELALAEQGLVLAYPDYAERLLALPHINWALYEGGHHLHMEGAQSILGLTYNKFFQRL